MRPARCFSVAFPALDVRVAREVVHALTTACYSVKLANGIARRHDSVRSHMEDLKTHI